MLARGEVILPAEPSHPAIPRMGLAPARVGGMAEKGWVAPPAKAYGNFRGMETGDNRIPVWINWIPVIRYCFAFRFSRFEFVITLE